MTTYAVLASNPGTEANATDHVVKPSPFIFAYCKWSKPEGLGTRLTWPWYINHLTVFCCSKCINEFDVALYQKGVVFTTNIVFCTAYALQGTWLFHCVADWDKLWFPYRHGNQFSTSSDLTLPWANLYPTLTLGVCVCVYLCHRNYVSTWRSQPCLIRLQVNTLESPTLSNGTYQHEALGTQLHLCGCHPLTTLLRLALWSSCVHLNFLQPKWPQELIAMTNWMHSIRAQHCGASLSKTCATIAANEIYRHMHNIGTESTCWSRHTFTHGVIHAAHWSRIFNVVVVISC